MGVRTRLTLTLVALVAVTVVSIGFGVSAFMDASLRDALSSRTPASRRTSTSRSCSRARTRGRRMRRLRQRRGLPEAFSAARGRGRVIADFGDGDVTSHAGGLPGRPGRGVTRACRRSSGQASSATRCRRCAGGTVLIVAGRQGGLKPDAYFIFPAQPVDDVLAQLRLGLLGAALVAICMALLTAG